MHLIAHGAKTVPEKENRLLMPKVHCDRPPTASKVSSRADFMSRRVLIIAPRFSMYPCFTKMIAEGFSSIGCAVNICHVPDATVFAHDVVLLTGLSQYDGGLTRWLSRRPEKKPVTVLWQLEPLPPVQLSVFGERIGFRVAKCDWGRLPPGLAKVLGNMIPFRTQTLRLIRRWLVRPYAQYVARQPEQEGWIQFDTEIFFKAMVEWVRIRALHRAGCIDQFFATVQPRVEFLRSRGISADLLPFGYHPDWGGDLAIERDIDVLFLGALVKRRGVLVHQLQQQLERRGRKLTAVRRAFGEARTELLNRTRIMLVLLRTPHDMPAMRLLLGMACGALVVCEKCAGTSEFRSGEHFVMAGLEQLPEVIDYYLTHEDERCRIARQGHEFVTRELTIENMLCRLLDQIKMEAHL